MARMSEIAEGKFYEAREILAAKIQSIPFGSPERAMASSLASLCQGLGGLAIAVRQVYDKLEEIDRRLAHK